MSPRAAWRLEQWGFEAYDYALGKSDWLAWGLDHEGEADLVGAHLTIEVPTCGLEAPVGSIRRDLEGATADVAVVVTEERIVLGRLSAGRIADVADDVPAAEVMREGPTTVRPATEVADLLHRMTHAEVTEVLVTRSDGRLLGIFESATSHR